MIYLDLSDLIFIVQKCRGISYIDNRGSVGAEGNAKCCEEVEASWLPEEGV